MVDCPPLFMTGGGRWMNFCSKNYSTYHTTTRYDGKPHLYASRCSKYPVTQDKEDPELQNEVIEFKPDGLFILIFWIRFHQVSRIIPAQWFAKEILEPITNIHRTLCVLIVLAAYAFSAHWKSLSKLQDSTFRSVVKVSQ